MKRITVWIDSEDRDIVRVSKELERFLNSLTVSHKIVDVCEIKLPGNDK